MDDEQYIECEVFDDDAEEETQIATIRLLIPPHAGELLWFSKVIGGNEETGSRSWQVVQVAHWVRDCTDAKIRIIYQRCAIYVTRKIKRPKF